MYLGKVKEISKDFIKSLVFGRSDSRIAPQIAPYGIDSKPVINETSVYCVTDNNSKSVTLGYIIKSDKTESGETRIYASDKEGNESFYIYMKNDGTCEIGGNADNLVKWTGINTSLQNEVTLINAELVKISTAINAIVSGSYVVTPITIDISTSKTSTIKTS